MNPVFFYACIFAVVGIIWLLSTDDDDDYLL